MMEFLMMLLKYRVYFFLFEFSLYPSIHLFKKWRDARGRQREIYRVKMEKVMLISILIYLLIISSCVYIFGIDEFREVVWTAVLAKVVFHPVVLAIRWITSKMPFREEVIAYVKDRKEKGFLEVDMQICLVPGTILYFVMLPFALGAGVVSLVFGLFIYIAYKDSYQIRKESSKLSFGQTVKGLWKDHSRFIWAVIPWIVIYLILGSVSKMTYVLPLLVFIPIAINMDLHLKKHKILKARQVNEHAEKTSD